MYNKDGYDSMYMSRFGVGETVNVRCGAQESHNAGEGHNVLIENGAATLAAGAALISAAMIYY